MLNLNHLKESQFLENATLKIRLLKHVDTK